MQTSGKPYTDPSQGLTGSNEGPEEKERIRGGGGRGQVAEERRRW